MPVFPFCSLPQSSDGFYATNNQFQVNGPRGFSELRTLENDDLFVRMDLPGVPRNSVTVTLDGSKKAVTIAALAPKEHKHDSSPRRYLTTTGLLCDCCEISGFSSNMLDGVLRLLLSKKKINPEPPSCIGRRDTDPNDPSFTGPVLVPHPFVVEGPQMAYESKHLQNGGLYLRLDVPGVPKDNFNVVVEGGRVMVIGQAPAVGFDSAGRGFAANVAMLGSTRDIPSRRMKRIAKNGVLRLIIPPL